MHDIIYKSLQARLQHREVAEANDTDTAGMDDADAPRLTCTRIEGADAIQEVVMIDQTPIGRTPRSNPVTYIKAFDIIRGIFCSYAHG